jgi:hypothetical protein
MYLQVDRVNLLGCQTASSQLDTLTGLVDVTPEGLPSIFFIEPDPSIAFLAQDIQPMPSIQLTQDRHRAKFAVSDQENSCSARDQLTDISQQSQLLTVTAVSFDMFDPGPGNRDGPFSICQTNDQQLMPKANLGAIYDQPDFSDVPELSFQPPPSDGLVPFPHSDGGIIQQPAQSSGGAQQPGRTRDLSGNAAQTHRPALIDPYHQPGKIAGLGDTLPRSQFLNSAIPCIIEVVDRHRITPFLKWFRKTNFSGEFMPINYSVVNSVRWLEKN